MDRTRIAAIEEALKQLNRAIRTQENARRGPLAGPVIARASAALPGRLAGSPAGLGWAGRGAHWGRACVRKRAARRCLANALPASAACACACALPRRVCRLRRAGRAPWRTSWRCKSAV